MRIPALAVPVVVMMVFGPAEAAPTPKFQSADDYMKLCGVARPGGDCKEAFMEANNWVRFNSDARVCEPDQKTSFGGSEYDASVSEEIGGAIGWLKQHPESVSLDYVQSLGHALVALYACK
ncbi:MAG TPA: hypothetical protein VNW15_14430 [Rhizomicrobium sp.]|nr:hypothetical protein [Rhizomicrobium sp.]